MGRKEKYDVVIIGSGSAGFSAAFAARALGVSVCIIEKGKLGGECPNEACVPSKAFHRVAYLQSLARNAKHFGLRNQTKSVAMSDLKKYIRRVVDTITGGGNKGDRFLRLAKRQGITIRFGTGKFIDSNTVQVDGGVLEGKAFVVATGSRDFIPPIAGLDNINFIGWKDVRHLAELPKSLAVIGGGAVGSEFATIFALLGVPVTLIQRGEHLLEKEDAEVIKMVEQDLKELGVEVLTDSLTTEVGKIHGHVKLTLDKAGKEEYRVARTLLVAAGKRADTDDLGLEEIGVKLTKAGEIHTNIEQCSSVKHIFAAGDVDDGSARLTHTAHAEGVVAGNNAALKVLKKRTGKQKISLKVVPHVTFLVRELASVGLTAKEVIELHGSVLVGRHNQSSLGRSVADGGEHGFIKLVADPVKRTLLGGTIYGPHAGEMIHEIALAVQLGVKIDALGQVVRAFPTYSEGITIAALRARIE